MSNTIIKLSLLYLWSFSCFAQVTQVDFRDFDIGSLILLNHIDTVIAVNGPPENIEAGKEGMNFYSTLYRYDGFTVYVGSDDGLIYAFEIDSPDFATARKLKVGSSFKDIVETHLYPSKRDEFVRCGPFDLNYKNYTHAVTYDISYLDKDENGDDDEQDWKGKVLVFFLKDDVITRIFIYQGQGC